MSHRFRQLDVFGEAMCTGNPVAVVLDADGLDEATLRRFSVWSNLSECTFVLPPTTPGVDHRVCVDGERLAFAAPPQTRSGPVDADLLTTVIEILGVEREQVVCAEWLDNGPGWVGVLLDSADTVLDLRPDASAHPGRWGIGVMGPRGAEAEADFELRAFFTEGIGPLGRIR